MRRSWGRRKDGEPGFWYHSQNLNERQHGPDGPMWRHGRAWLHYHDGREAGHRDRCLGWEWHCFRRDPWPKIGIEINGTFGEDYDLATTFALPWLGAFYTHLEGCFPRRWKAASKNFSVSIFEEYLWIEFFWTDPGETWGENKNRFPAFRLSLNWKALLWGSLRHQLEWLGADGEWRPAPERPFEAPAALPDP